ncbi:MAG: carboxy terminal-processing peptidase [Bacteroidales bacterium]|nr:carboxy terminal-processing peptidase [Bacteroidales bacterium]
MFIIFTSIILVISFSASASEILAAAMQDYGRAVIVGTTSTYGKGSVQNVVDIDQSLPAQMDDVKPLGSLKITIQKFYRIDGSTTQLKGVIPDIVLPDNYSYLEIGEKELDYPLAWDQIPAVKYQKWSSNLSISDLKKEFEKRSKKDTILKAIDEAALWLKNQRDMSLYSLEYEAYQKNKEDVKTKSSKYKELNKVKTGLVVSSFQKEDKLETRLDTVKNASQKEWYKELENDVQLYNTYSIMLDMLSK